MRSTQVVAIVCGTPCIVSISACHAPAARLINMDMDGARYHVLTREAFRITQADVIRHKAPSTDQEECLLLVDSSNLR